MIPWLACTIYNYTNVFFVFFCDTSKASENPTFILNKVLFCQVVVLLCYGADFSSGILLGTRLLRYSRKRDCKATNSSVTQLQLKVQFLCNLSVKWNQTREIAPPQTKAGARQNIAMLFILLIYIARIPCDMSKCALQLSNRKHWKHLMYMVYMEEDGTEHRGDSPILFEKSVSCLKSLLLG